MFQMFVDGQILDSYNPIAYTYIYIYAEIGHGIRNRSIGEMDCVWIIWDFPQRSFSFKSLSGLKMIVALFR